MNEMLILGLAPNSQIYNNLIAGYCKANDMDKAFEVLAEMKKMNFV